MKCQREKFNLQRKYAYLNCAYMSPLMKKVENAGIKGLRKKRKPFHLSPEDFFKEANTVRLLFSELINNDDASRISIIPSVSYAIANVANNLPFDGGQILLASQQFPSNVYPWMALKDRGFDVEFVGPTDSTNGGESWNANILDQINENTRVVAIGHVHWSDGTLFDLFAIRKRLDEVGGLLIIDGTQSVGALPFDVEKIRPDALICAAYKWLLGPYSIGLAYYGKVFDLGVPIEESWINRKNSDDFSQLVDYEETYRDHASRYNVGEHSNFILLPMLHQSLKQLIHWGPENIQEYCHRLIADPIKELQEIGYQVDDEVYRSSHLFGIRPGVNTSLDEIKKSLAKNRVSVSFRGKALRVSPNVYNDEMDMRKLLKALKEPILAG